MTLTVGSLFSGVGGLDLGLQRAGFETRWFAENDDYCSRVLAKHWPTIPNLGDVTTIEWEDVERVDLICGGFPCQDISILGKRAGLSGEHSGLWAHFAAAVRHLRPRYVFVENIPSLLVRGMGDILGDLADVGYDAEWEVVPAAAVGATHLRARVWLVAYPGSERDGLPTNRVFTRRDGLVDSGWWTSEPGVPRVADGFPNAVDRRQCTGNAVVPQVAEWIGRQIMDAVA